MIKYIIYCFFLLFIITGEEAFSKPIPGSLLKKTFDLIWRPDERIVDRATKNHCERSVSGYNLSDSAYNVELKHCYEDNHDGIRRAYERYTNGVRIKDEWEKCKKNRLYYSSKLAKLEREHSNEIRNRKEYMVWVRSTPFPYKYGEIPSYKRDLDVMNTRISKLKTEINVVEDQIYKAKAEENNCLSKLNYHRYEESIRKIVGD